MALDQSVVCADYSKYGSFLAGNISKTSCPLLFFFNHGSAIKTLIKTTKKNRNFNKTTFVTSMS